MPCRIKRTHARRTRPSARFAAWLIDRESKIVESRRRLARLPQPRRLPRRRTDDVVHLRHFLQPGSGVTVAEITPVSDQPLPLPIDRRSGGSTRPRLGRTRRARRRARRLRRGRCFRQLHGAVLARRRARGVRGGRSPTSSSGRRVLLAAFDDGELVGTVQVDLATPPNQPHRGDIAKLLVRRSARRRGIAAQLMEAAEREALAEGKTLLVLDTVTGDAAERLYERLGWTRVGVIPNYALYPDGRPCATTVFYKQLGVASARRMDRAYTARLTGNSGRLFADPQPTPSTRRRSRSTTPASATSTRRTTTRTAGPPARAEAFEPAAAPRPRRCPRADARGRDRRTRSGSASTRSATPERRRWTVPDGGEGDRATRRASPTR